MIALCSHQEGGGGSQFLCPQYLTAGTIVNIAIQVSIAIKVDIADAIVHIAMQAYTDVGKQYLSVQSNSINVIRSHRRGSSVNSLHFWELLVQWGRTQNAV